MKPVRRSSGFVLILALVVLVVAATVLAASARRTSGLALRAGTAQQDLQVKWGSESFQALALGQAETLLAAAFGNEPVASRAVDLTLGGIAFRAIVSDEQAKASVNRLWEIRGDSGVMVAVQHLQVGAAHPLQPQVKPDPAFQPGTTGTLPFSSFEQVAATARPWQAVAVDGSASLTSRVTFWGSGRLNVRRAEPPVLREMLEGVLNEDEISALLLRRRQAPDAGLDELIDAPNVPRERLVLVRQVVTDASLCHSAWIIARGTTRDWYRLYVRQEGSSANGPLHWRFVW